nr:hypothetical protein [Streptococcus mitis]
MCSSDLVEADVLAEVLALVDADVLALVDADVLADVLALVEDRKSTRLKTIVYDVVLAAVLAVV